MKYERILKAIEESCWLIHKPKLEQIIGVIEARANGVTLDRDYWQELQEKRQAMLGSKGPGGRIHVMGLHGTIMQSSFSLMSSLGTNTEDFAAEFDQAIASDDVSAVMIHVDSPGGSVFGVDELSKRIYQARGTKPIRAVASPEAYSAAYYLASAADDLWVQPTGMVGSVGVLATHIDYSEFNKKVGAKVSYITAGKFKAEGNPDEPLDADARAEIQRIVDRYYGMFIKALARNRGVDAETVEADFGQGRVFGAKEAVKRGMADKVGTFQEAMAGLSKGIRRRGTKAARKRLALTGA